VGGGEAGPAEPEEADGEEGAFDAAEVEAAFRGGGEFAVVAGDFFLVDAKDCGEEGSDAYSCHLLAIVGGVHGDPRTGEYGAILLNVEMMVCGKDEGYC